MQHEISTSASLTEAQLPGSMRPWSPQRKRIGTWSCCMLPQRHCTTPEGAIPTGDRGALIVAQQDRGSGQPASPRFAEKAARNLSGFLVGR